MLDVLVPTAPFDALADLLLERYADVAEEISLRPPKDSRDDEAFARLVARLKRP
jgi:hypothetical protein